MGLPESGGIYFLNLAETATLINATDKDSVQLIKEGDRELKKRIYGNRIVLFAPLYVGNKCSNDCTYCGFRASNTGQVRKTLTEDERVKEIEALEDSGQKRRKEAGDRIIRIKGGERDLYF